MAKQVRKRNLTSRTRKACRHRRAIGLGACASAFLAFGMSPLATAPAHADEFDLVIDPIISSMQHALSG
jgi:hypothetical protein